MTGRRLDKCDPKDLANLAWGFTMLGHRRAGGPPSLLGPTQPAPSAALHPALLPRAKPRAPSPRRRPFRAQAVRRVAAEDGRGVADAP